MRRSALALLALPVLAAGGAGGAHATGGFDPVHPPQVAGPQLTCADVGRHVAVLSTSGPDQGLDQVRCRTAGGGVSITRGLRSGTTTVPPAVLFANDCRGIAKAPVGRTAGITGPTCGSATFLEVYEGTSVVAFSMPQASAVPLATTLGL